MPRVYKRPRRYTETWEYGCAVRRMIRGYGARVAHEDIGDLRELVGTRADLDAAIVTAIAGLREHGSYSWAEIGEVLGMTRQGAQQWWAARAGEDT